ncbi:uncharacterized protein LOC135267351 [Tribolium castaneum]|uniref:uncharacterized protein LOC135267351 n=1 Tax=Tribolium castaneum TaxID=7070 RepID=UPI0030FE7399
MEIKDVITNIPETNKYEKVKEELIKRLSSSQEQKTRRLLEREEMGDRTPSQFLRHLRDLAGANTGRLPRNMQAILATQSKCTLDEVAVSADKIHETMPEARVFAINNNANPSSAITGTHGNFDATISALSQQVQDLSRQLAALQTSQSGYVSRFGTRAPSRYRLRSRSKPRDGKCWFHHRFGDKARKCEAPCSYQKNGTSSQ